MSTNPISDNRLVRLLRYAHALLRWAGLILVLIILIHTQIVTIQRVRGVSMLPTLEDSQIIPVCILCSRIQPLKVGDIVVATHAGDRTVRFVKRVAALPGEVVEYKDQKLTLAPDEYFLLGDNAEESTDSRAFGPVKYRHIVGTVIGK